MRHYLDIDERIVCGGKRPYTKYASECDCPDCLRLMIREYFEHGESVGQKILIKLMSENFEKMFFVKTWNDEVDAIFLPGDRREKYWRE